MFQSSFSFVNHVESILKICSLHKELRDQLGIPPASYTHTIFQAVVVNHYMINVKKDCCFITMCNAHNKVTHIKQQKYFHHLNGRGYPRPLKWWKYFLLFYMCHVAMGLTHCYKKTAVFYIYILKKIIKHDSVLVVSFCGCVCMLACRCDKSWTFRCIIMLFLLQQENCKIMCGEFSYRAFCDRSWFSGAILN